MNDPVQPLDMEERALPVLDLGEGLCGLVRLEEGAACWIHGDVAPDDIVQVALDFTGPRPTAQLLGVSQFSEQRVDPPCLHFGQCGGCDRMHLSLPAQSRWKTKRIRDVLERIARLSAPPVNELVRPSSDRAYRNKAVFYPLKTAAGWRWGYHAMEESHRLTPIDHCLLLPDWMSESTLAIGKALDAHPVWASGLTGLMLRQGCSPDDRGIAFYFRPEVIQNGQLSAFWETWPCLESIPHLVLVEAMHPTRYPQREHLVKGDGRILEKAGGLTLSVPLTSFFQINPVGAAALVDHVLHAFAPQAGQRLLDLYCGVGFFALPLAAAGAEVLGIELNADAVDAARTNAQRLGLNNAHFEAHDLRRALDLPLEVDGILVDPPRQGLGKVLIQWLCAHPVPRLVYVSCDPATLARDLQKLCAEGPYGLEHITPVDLFPHTRHVESVAVLTVRN